MSTKKRVLYAVMTIFYIVIFYFMAWPSGTAITDRIEPHLLGLPFYQGVILYGSLLMAIGLIVWFVIEVKIEDKEDETEEVREDDK